MGAIPTGGILVNLVGADAATRTCDPSPPNAVRGQ